MSANHGFVYLLGNDSMPDLYKIGSTTRHPSYRVDELSRATGVPSEFLLLFYADIVDHSYMEAWLLEKWSSNRSNTGREFLRLTLNELEQVIADIAECTNDIVFKEYEPFIYFKKQEAGKK